jgi:sporulation integral membrane protein YtvI
MKASEWSRLKKTAAFLAVIASAAAGAFLLVRLGFLFAPFLLAFIIASLMEPVIKLLENKAGINRKFAAPAILSVFLAVPGFLSAMAAVRLAAELKSVSGLLPDLFSGWYEAAADLMEKVRNTWIPPELAGNAGSIIGSLLNSLTGLADTVVKSLLLTAVSIPQALMFILTTIMAAYFFSSGRPAISDFIVRQLPDSWRRRLNGLKSGLFSALSGYMKGAMILMAITFSVLYAGFCLMRLDYPLLLAFLVATVDALPVIGTGTILLPWALFSYIAGNMPLGSSILILYATVMVVRQLTEPKIMGRQIGLHPLLTLASMYAGYRLDGLAGMIAGPVAVLLVKSVLKIIYNGKPLKNIL